VSGGVDPRARRRARRALIQAVYQWQLSGGTPDSIAAQFRDSGALDKADQAFFDECLAGIIRGADALDDCFAGYLDRKLTELNHVERAILRAGAYELKKRIDVPFKVVIDEYVELAKIFGAAESHRYVNGVLDRVSMDLRRVERV